MRLAAPPKLSRHCHRHSQVQISEAFSLTLAWTRHHQRKKRRVCPTADHSSDRECCLPKTCLVGLVTTLCHVLAGHFQCGSLLCCFEHRPCSLQSTIPPKWGSVRGFLPRLILQTPRHDQKARDGVTSRLHNDNFRALVAGTAASIESWAVLSCALLQHRRLLDFYFIFGRRPWILFLSHTPLSYH